MGYGRLARCAYLGMGLIGVNLMGWTGLPAASANDLVSIPEQAKAGAIEEIPVAWRDYYARARIAERIADPLQRCLAFPDLPGNQWPAGHAAAHCRHHHSNTRPILADIRNLIDKGDVAALDRRMDAILQQHYAAEGFSEEIHDTFEYLLNNSDEETEQLTAAWLEKAPDSAYAHLARGSFYRASAWAARGEKYSSETSRESMRRMSEFADKALPHLEKAASLNPKLIPAFTSMIDLGMLDSRMEVERKGIKQAEKLDPACLELARKKMQALQPRWGGTYEQMLAYSNQLTTYLDRRPQLSMYVGKPYSDRGDRLIADKQFTQETQEILDVALAVGTDEDALRDAANVSANRTDVAPDHWRAVAYLLQETRFRETSAWGARQIAWRLGRGEPEWSLRYSKQAVSSNPENSLGHYLLAGSYYKTRQFDLAEKQYLIALQDSDYRRASLLEVSRMWMFDSRLGPKEAAAKARPYVDRWLDEYPKDGAAWIMRLHVNINSDGFVDDQLIDTVLEMADRKDPWQASVVGSLEKARKAKPKK